MIKKSWYRIHAILVASVWIAACGSSATAVPTPSPLPTARAAPTLAPTSSPIPSPIPTLTTNEWFQEMSRTWRVAYYEESSHQVCAMYADGRNKLCFDNDAYGFEVGRNIVPGSWSPDGSRFVINAGSLGIHIWELGGSITTFKEAIEGAVFYNPVWSPDGNYIAYTIGPIQWSVIPEIGSFIDSLDGSVHRKIFPEGISMDWSPDGKRIAYSNDDIFVVSLDGGDAINLTQHPGNDGFPKWSPDGESIAFLSDRNGSWDVFVMNADGSRARKVADYPTNPENPYTPFHYTWLPNSKHLLFHIKLIDVETGEIAELQFPFDASTATWFMPAEEKSIPPLPAPHCADGWSRLYAGIYAVVAGETDDPPNRVRAVPDTGDEIVSQLYPGAIVLVSEGPVCADGLVFWKVENKSIPGGAGWTAEGDRKEYFLEPYKP